MECTQASKLQCKYKLCYEQASDLQYYLLNATHEHQPKCLLDPGLTPGQVRAKGVNHISAGLLVEAHSARAAGFNTADVNKLLKNKAKELGLDVTWNWHHLDHKLSTVFGNVRSDASGLTDWLGERKYKQGLMTEYTTDLEGCLERAFFVEKGAKEHWAQGNHVAFYDTTHSTNHSDMKLGCICGMDQDGKTILLATSLIKHEDAKTFQWVFSKFIEAMGSEPNIMFTDGDLGMGAALKMFPRISHLLCIFHLGKNLITHTDRLFPRAKEDAAAKEEFKKAFKDLMYDGFNDAEAAEETFDVKWDAMLAIVAGTTPCPSDLNDNEDDIDDAYVSCNDELGAEDDETAYAAFENRVKGRAKKTAAWLAWSWLRHMKEIRFKWARCFVIQHLTFGAFSTQRSESWHSAIKAYLAGRKKLLELCQQVSNKVHAMADNAEETVARLAERHRKDRFKQPALVSPMQGQITPFAVKKLLEEEEKSAPMVARLDPEAGAYTRPLLSST
jgi:hypothetical protein